MTTKTSLRSFTDMRGRTRPLDPTEVRLSDHFLLSDFLGCHSVYSKGLKNIFIDPTGIRLLEGQHLCETLLEPLMNKYGPVSISYGYISPELSKKIVTYMNPNEPSYHRWDKGAAADVCIHSQIMKTSPIATAHEIDETFPYSRMITYSESPFICLATQINEGDEPRRAFYENRYLGKKGAKPQFVKKSPNKEIRIKQGKTLSLAHDWRGAGYPTYHGGGIRQLQHYRPSRYSTVSDFLFSSYAVRTGVANIPDLRLSANVFRLAGRTYDMLLESLETPRLSIVRGFESFRFNDYPLFSWKNHFAIDFKPPTYLTASDIADAALAIEYVQTVAVDNQKGIARIIGKDIRDFI